MSHSTLHARTTTTACRTRAAGLRERKLNASVANDDTSQHYASSLDVPYERAASCIAGLMRP